MRIASAARRFALTIPTLAVVFATGCASPGTQPAMVAPLSAKNGVAVASIPASAPAPDENGAVANGAKTLAWPQLGFDSGHSGYNPSEKTLSPQNVANLSLLWSTPTDNTAQGLIAVQGTLYGESSDLLYALNASTGTVLWSVSGINTSAKAPAVAGALVLAPCSTQSQGSGLCAYQANNGAPSWSVLANCFACGLTSTPTVAGKLAYAEYGIGGTVYDALAEKTGKVAWDVYTGNHCAGNFGANADPIAGGVAYYTIGCLGTDNHTSICAFNAKNGNAGWCTELTGPGCGAAFTLGVSEAQGAVFANVVYSGGNCAEQLVALDAKTGAQRWADEIPGNNPLGPTQPAIADGIVYDLVGENSLEAFSAKTGKMLWSQTAANADQGVSIANGVVYTLCPGTAGLCAINAKTGQLLWVSNTGGGSFGSMTTPVILNGVVYAACATNNFCAFGLSQNKARRTAQAPSGERLL